MNKLDFVNELAGAVGIPRNKTLEITNTALEILTKNLNQKKKIQFIGFGVIEVKVTPERMARNPRTKESVLIPRRYRAVFRPSNRLLDPLNGKYAE